jgi:outer membrane protein
MRIFLLFLWIQVVNAQVFTPLKNPPLYEIGVLAGSGYVPDYPASDQGRVRTIGFPFFIYRGQTFRNDRDNGTYARLLNNSNFEFDFSFGGAFPASSEENKAREGMEDLDWLIQFGPRLVLVVKRDPNWGEILIRTSFQYTLSTDGQFTEHQGYRIAPSIIMRKRNFFSRYLEFFTSVMLNYGDNKLNDYFYSIDQKEITSQRKAYNAQAGFISTNFFMGLLYDFNPKTRWFGGIEFSSFKDSVNRSSDLHRTDSNTSVFFGFSHLFYESTEKGYR